MKLRLTALSISSIDMNTVMIFLRNRKPAIPSENRMALRSRYHDKGTAVGIGGMSDFLPCEDNRADNGDQDQDGCHFERQQILGKEAEADFLCGAGSDAAERH